EFATHSSELMPGGSPSFFTEAEVERLFERLEALFEAAARSLRAATLTEYRAVFMADSRAA
ncbi:MAG: deacetylase, partial [Acidobacteria bacterium]|nr:deacetylase [Acidobacteriota bacterium]